MSELPWVRFFPSDWLGGTRGMSAAETGIYITLVATMYERGEPVPEDHSRLARLCGASNSSFKAALETLISEGKIVRCDTGLWNDRVEKESVYRSEKSEVGKQAAAARWQKTQQNQQSTDANAMHPQSVGFANQKPDTRNKKEDADASKRGGDLAEFKAELSTETDASRIDAIIKHRRSKRGQITGHAARLFVSDAAACGLSVTEAVDTCISRNWITVKPEYFAARHQPRSTAPPAGRRPNAVEANLSIRTENHEPASQGRRVGDVELLPPDNTRLRRLISDAGQAVGWPERSGDH